MLLSFGIGLSLLCLGLISWSVKLLTQARKDIKVRQGPPNVAYLVPDLTLYNRWISGQQNSSPWLTNGILRSDTFGVARSRSRRSTWRSSRKNRIAGVRSTTDNLSGPRSRFYCGDTWQFTYLCVVRATDQRIGKSSGEPLLPPRHCKRREFSCSLAA